MDTPRFKSAGPIFLVRHGQTEFNVHGRLQGRQDSPLTDDGVAHAHAVAGFLRREVPAVAEVAIWSSPLGRAASTARILRDRLKPEAEIRYDERLSEAFCGSWEGLTLEQIGERWPAVRGINSTRRAWARFCPDGETPQEVTARLQVWLSERNGHPTIAVTHGIARGLLVASYGGFTEEQMLDLPVAHHIIFKLDRGAVSVIDTSGQLAGQEAAR